MTQENRLCVALDARRPDYLHRLLTIARKLAEAESEEAFEILIVTLPTKPSAVRAIGRVLRQWFRSKVSSVVRSDSHLSTSVIVARRKNYGSITILWAAPIWTVGNLLRSLFWAVTTMARFRQNSPEMQREASMKGIHLGDVVASSYLRVAPKRSRTEDGALLFFELWRCGLLCDWALNSSGVRSKYITTAEPTYSHAVMARVFERNGSEFIEVGWRGEIRKSTSWLVHSMRPFARVSRLPHYQGISGIDPEQIGRRRLAGKIEDPYVTAPSSDNPTPDASMWPASYLRWVDVPSRSAQRAVIFLHEFGDGQLFCGIDGFSDLVEWAEFSAIHLSEGEWTEIFIRPHPHHGRYAISWGHLRALEKKIQKLTKVRLVSPLAPFQDLVAGAETLVVSHHGTVVLQAVSLGRNAVFSKMAPFGTNWELGFSWQTPEEYARILHSTSLLRAPDQATLEFRKSELANYLYSINPRSGFVSAYSHYLAQFVKDKQEFVESVPPDQVFTELRRLLSLLNPEESMALLPNSEDLDYVESFGQWFGGQ